MDPNQPTRPTDPNDIPDEQRTADGAKLGAGLEESRINENFAEFVRKWSTPILLVFAVALGGIAINQRVQAAQRNAVDEAFLQLEGSGGSAAVLKSIAIEYADKGAVPMLAQLEAARIHINKATTGVPDDAIAQAMEADDYLTDEEIKQEIETAQGILNKVLDSASNDENLAEFELAARWDLATAAMTLRDFDQAQAQLEAYVELATSRDIVSKVALGQARLEALPELRTLEPFKPAPVVEAVVAPSPEITVTPEPGVFNPDAAEPVTIDVYDDTPVGPPAPGSGN